MLAKAGFSNIDMAKSRESEMTRGVTVQFTSNEDPSFGSDWKHNVSNKSNQIEKKKLTTGVVSKQT